MILSLLLAADLLWPQEAASNSLPLVSATDAAYLSCSTWTGKEWSSPSARSARTPVLESPRGVRAYGEVTVAVKGADCENNTVLYLSEAKGKTFKAVYTVPGGNGNGIRLVGWSPDGNRLLAELNTWEYETDRGFAHSPLIYDLVTGHAREIQIVYKSFSSYFGSAREFEPAIEGWEGNEQVLIRISKTPDDESYGQHFCVKQPTLFVFDTLKENVRLADTK